MSTDAGEGDDCGPALCYNTNTVVEIRVRGERVLLMLREKVVGSLPGVY